MKIVNVKIEDIKYYQKNSKKHPDEQINKIANSIEEFGFNVPVILDKNNILIAGHGRVLAARGLDISEIPCIYKEGLTREQVIAYRIADNKSAESDWDMDILKGEFESLQLEDFDLSLTGFDEDEIIDLMGEYSEVEDDFELDKAYDKAKESTITIARGEIFMLGNHRLMCGDATSEEDVKELMGEEKADMVFTDPPYGMKKEKDGVLNDNLNYDDLLEFNKQWIPLTFKYLTEVGSWYCWGIEEPLMDVYSEILKPMKKNQEITFRNLITWDKNNGQGQMAEEFRMYPIADEKCLFIMKGVQGFNNNSDNFFEKWDPIRIYLKDNLKLKGWNIEDSKRIAGHSLKSGCHWFDKSQWIMPTKDVYGAWQREAKGKAFLKEYDEIKKEYYSTRSYFNNTHDNMNNVWHFDRTSNEEKKLTGGHATPKPIQLCARGIKSSSKEGMSVLDLFGGSGSTLIACEQLGRKCFMMEIDPVYVEVICQRWEKLTGKLRVKIN